MNHRTMLLLSFALAVPAVRAEEKAERKEVARSAGEAGVLLRRAPDSKEWQPVPEKGALQSGDLVLGIDVGAALVSNNGAVRLNFRGDFDRTSPFPILETAVIPNAATDVDLDVTFDRGRIDLVNTREKGPARVRLHVRHKSCEIVLPQPGDRAAIEIYGRWPRGVPFKKDPKPGEGPALAIVGLAVKGEIELKGKEHHLTLKAPPGLALIEGDGLEEFDPKPEYLDKLPAWAVEGAPETERGKLVRALLGRFRKQVLAKGVGEALDAMMQSDNPLERRGAVILMGATDDLPRLAHALLSAKHIDVWDDAVLTMRHWIGRAPGQDQKLYNWLVTERMYKPNQAESLLQLLHSFSDDEVAKPELYEVLINYLASERPGLRGLAYWHLVRLAPAGKKIAYNPLGPKEERDKGVEEWRKLIPPGKLPPEDK